MRNREVRRILRLLADARLVHGVAILTLALGIAASVATFTVLDRALLEPLPYSAPDEVVEVWAEFEGLGLDRFWLSEVEVAAVRERGAVFRGVAAHDRQRLVLTGRGEPRRIEGERVTPGFFRLLGADLALGRGFRAHEEGPGEDGVVVSSHRLWRALGGDPDLLGATIVLDGVPRRLVGVAPPGFRAPSTLRGEAPVDLWLPLTRPASPDVGNHYLGAVARIAEDTDVEAARAALDRVAEALVREHPEALPPSNGFGLSTGRLRDEVVRGVETGLLILGGAVGLVLLIACVNVANLLLVQAERRHPEMALRTALGAGRGRLLRMLVAESAVLVLVAGSLGTGLAYAALHLLSLPASVGMAAAGAVEPAPATLGVALSVCLLSALLFGSAPALAARRVDLRRALSSRSSGAPGGRRLRNGLIVFQLAMATVLTIGAGLMIGGLWKLQSTDPGFRSARVLTVPLWLPELRYPEGPAVPRSYQRLVDRLEELPTVAVAGAVSSLPLAEGANRQSFVVEGATPAEGAATPVANLQVVHAGYFEALEIPLRAGRTLERADRATTLPVVVVDERFARHHLAGRRPLGARIRLGGSDGDPWYTVVGVVGAVRQRALDLDGEPTLFVPHDQVALTDELRTRHRMTLVARARAAPGSILGAVQEAIWSLDRQLPVESAAPLDRVVAESLGRRRSSTLLLGAFSGLSLFLAAIGVYGMVAHSVARREREIGVRMALGARRGAVFGTVLRESLRSTGLGLGFGIAAGAVLDRALASLVPELGGLDPGTVVAVATVLGVTSLAAGILPASRAMRISPAGLLKRS